MEKRLNIPALQDALRDQGMSAAALAENLEVSREAVSKWLNGESFPRPDKLLRLGSLLSLGFGDLVMRDEPNAPVVAFRRMRGTKTKDSNVTHAVEMGRSLQHLVPYLPFDTLTVPPTLNHPACDYDYIRRVTASVRADIHVDIDAKIDFTHLIRRFRELQTVLVPVLWGRKSRHENAVHIFLPESRTTWVYLNLDVNVHDFKFWMAHELGHTLTPELRGEQGEDFADAFAAALLFPHDLSRRAYEESFGRAQRVQLDVIQKWARELLISPYNVYCRINEYARRSDLAPLDLNSVIHPVTTKFNNAYQNVSDTLFDGVRPSADTYIRAVRENFESPFFEVLGQYLRKSDRGPGFVQTVLDSALLDAKAVHAELL